MRQASQSSFFCGGVGVIMSVLFWSLAAALLIVAIAFVATPLLTRKPLQATPKYLIAAFVPLASVGLYAYLGSPSTTDLQHVASRPASSVSQEHSLGSVASMIDGLVARLEIEPDDADGWILLARSYQHIGENEQALSAYEHAVALGKSDITLETTLLGDGLSGYTASAAAEPALYGRVALSQDAASKVLPTDTLFIFAKETRDHRMPVVALRKNASELPFDFVLTDKQAMVPGTRIGDFDRLVVTAKISRSGNATDNSLGLEAWSDAVSPSNTDRIDLLIGDADE